jgi:predicted RNase H-like HicB family nuclease
VQVLEVEAKHLVIITVLRAKRTQRPVYINNNPMTGTFKRNFEGDYCCTPEEVRQMLRDAANEPQDIQILEGFNLTDLDPETLKAFRQRFVSREPDHPWLGLDDKNLLIQLGGWQRDRITEKEGLTLAGLLMFGQLRTATERISLLDLERISPTAAPLDIQTVHDEAFDVEAVTQEFFKEYRRTFEKVEGLIQGIGGDERKRLFTQKLFNRLMFIAFIEKKGWLKFQGSTDYLTAFWKYYQTDEETPNKNFYRDRLSHLFFSGLNNPQEQDIAGINNGGFLKELIGSVPYLNGGLFEQDDNDKNPKIIVPDDCIDTILQVSTGEQLEVKKENTQPTPLTRPLTNPILLMLTKYIQAALHQAKYKILSDDGTFFGEIPRFQGVWSNAETLEICREELAEVLEEWILLRVARNLPLPIVDGIELSIKEAT